MAKSIKVVLACMIVCFYFEAKAQIRIISDEEATTNQTFKNIGSSFSTNSNLGYEKTSWGETFYNPTIQNFKKTDQVMFERVAKIINFKGPKSKYEQGYSFKMPIQNLNAKEGFAYFTKENPKLKQRTEDIYWGFILNLKHNGIQETITITIVRAKSNSTYSIYTSYLNYNVNNTGWKQSVYDYPECDLEKTNLLQINPIWYMDKTEISWGLEKLTELPYFIDEIISIDILVGPMANIQVRNAEIEIPKMASQEGLDRYYSELSQLIQNEDFNSVKEKVKSSIKNGLSTETLVAFLAFSHLATGDYEECKKVATLLIDYKGKHMEAAYGLRGFANEALEDLNGALSDFAKAGKDGKEQYDRLYSQKNELNRSTTGGNKNYPANKKPALTR